MKMIDCTLRDGGYYNKWDFSLELVVDYLEAMSSLKIDFVEIGFRSLKNEGFKGAYAFSSDEFIKSLPIPSSLENKIGVMVNGSELSDPNIQKENLQKLFVKKSDSPVSLVRIACHIYEFEASLLASIWLKEQGYLVGINLMQIADKSFEEIIALAKKARDYPLDVLYFADSMGSLEPQQVSQIVKAFQKGWSGALGIHTHDNMGQAVANSIQAVKDGVSWVDSTVTGMGRGPGNSQTEFLTIALSNYKQEQGNPTKLFEIVRKYFKPMQEQYGWGKNPYYYLAGKYGIHPTYIQSMLQDSRYSDEDIIAVIEHLRVEGGKKYSLNTLAAARHFYIGEGKGYWSPQELLEGRDVLILGTGPGIKKYSRQVEKYIEKYQPYVIALNVQKSISSNYIDARAACHPIRLLADCHEHLQLQEPLITPFSMLPNDLQEELRLKKIYDFGLHIGERFEFHDTYCISPTSLVMAYSLALATSGRAKSIILAGFDGYEAGDPRNDETEEIFEKYQASNNSLKFYSITPTQYKIETKSIYGF